MLDYSPALIRDLHLMHNSGAMVGDDKEVIQRIGGAIHKSPKFILPTGAFRNFDGISDTERELFKPPYDVTIWEYNYPKEMQEEDMLEKGHVSGTKNTDITHRVNMLMRNRAVEQSTGDWLFVMFQRSQKTRWIMHPCTVSFNADDIHGNTIATQADFLEFITGDPYFTKEVRDDMHRDMGYEIATVVKAIAMLNCENVEHEAIERPVSRMKKQRFMKKFGVEPYQYRVLSISGERTYSVNGTTTPRKAGTRYHLRRGHFRRYKSGKVTWVRACKVGDINAGQVEKVYKL